MQPCVVKVECCVRLFIDHNSNCQTIIQYKSMPSCIYLLGDTGGLTRLRSFVSYAWYLYHNNIDIHNADS